MIKPSLIAAAFACLLAASPALADDAVAGHAVLAKPGGEALVIWDATPVVALIVKSKLADTDANLLLERDAIRVLAAMTPNLDKHANSVTVRVLYNKTGEVSPVYGARTFAGVERYAALKVAGTDAISNRDQWKSLDEKASIPGWFAFKITGLLPPR